MAARKTPEHAFEFGASKKERDAHIKKLIKDSKQDLAVLGKMPIRDVTVIPTGSIRLDVGLGIGGWPIHRVVEIFGAEGSGKTTLALQAAANCQKMGGIVAFVDAEHALNVEYAKDLGCDLDEMLIKQPDNGEQAMEVVLELVPKVNLIVVDSVAALTPKAELEGDIGDHHPGAQARLMSQSLRKITAAIGRSQCCVIFLNQTRQKIGVKFGSPKTTSGGNALKFYASIRCEVVRIGNVKEGDITVGQRDKVTVLKNKLSPPYRVVEFDLIFGEGTSILGECIDIGLEIGALDRSGSWYSFGDVSVLGTELSAIAGSRIGQGRVHAKHTLKKHPEFIDRMREIALRELRTSRADPEDD